MTHREKCNELKEIRAIMAKDLGIDLHQKECTFEGECKGTCPKCMAEELQLNTVLLSRKAKVLGAATIMATSLVACGTTDTTLSGDTVLIEEPELTVEPECNTDTDILEGDVEYIDENITEDTDILSGDVEYIEDNSVDTEEIGDDSNEPLTGDVQIRQGDSLDVIEQIKDSLGL